MRFEIWMTVDCEQCGAAFGEPCVDLGCGDPGCSSLVCARRARSLAAGESFHGGGNRERVLDGLDATPGAAAPPQPSPQDGAQGGPSGAQTRRTRAAPDTREPTR